jgi:L-cysteate sulfo-lyase
MTNTMIDQDRRSFIKAAGAAALAGAVSGCASLAKPRVAFDDIPRLSLTSLPTACNPMSNITAMLGGPDLYIKRDDVMELAHGGNKTRKLEYALAEALNSGAKAVVTQGGLQSNHVRQTCSGAAKVGLEAHVILSNPVPKMKDELMGSGNFLMDQLMGAHIYIAEDGRGPVVEKVLADLDEAGKNPYSIPAGASNGVGSLGYMNAARELIGQWDDMGISPSHIFTATGSCGTQAGLLMGLRYFGNPDTTVVGISVSAPGERLESRTREVLDMICDKTGIARDFIKDHDIIVNDEYLGDGYGRPSDAGIAAIRTVAENEGVILDPVYTGKCMSAVLDMLQNNKLEDVRDVVFLHTGGAPAIHPYAEYFRT